MTCASELKPLPLLPILMLTAACAGDASQPTGSIAQASFGATGEGEPVQLYTLTNAHGMEMQVTDYGGIITSLRVPDRAGEFADVVLGFDSLEPYLTNPPYFGALIGRYGNRIAGGRFALDGETYTLATNNGPNHLHGGAKGFDKVVWRAEPFERAEEVGVVLSYTSPAGEEGYPGTLETHVTYTLTNQDELVVDYHATTDAPTPVNLTQHSYFNLAGDGEGDILDHVVMVDADHFTPVDSTLIPTGEVRAVDGTPFDFRTPTPIGARIEEDDTQLRYGRGYDHNFVLNTPSGATPDQPMPDQPMLAARVFEPTSGRVLEIRTTEPGMQFYSGNFLDGTLTGKNGVVYRHRTGFAMETQHFPDSPNQPAFPSTVLRPGDEYRTRTVFRFAIQEVTP